MAEAYPSRDVTSARKDGDKLDAKKDLQLTTDCVNIKTQTRCKCISY